MMNNERAGLEQNTSLYWLPTAPSINSLRGIRYMATEGAGEGAGEGTPTTEAADTTIEPKEDTPDSGQEPEPTDAPEEAPKEESSQEPKPWGDDKDFNPEKAWNLIQGLKSDKTKLASSNSNLRLENTNLKDENNTLRADVESFKSEKTVGVKKSILDEYNLPESFTKFLIGDDEKDWRETAKELGSTRTSTAPKGPRTPKSGLEHESSDDLESIRKAAAERRRKSYRI